jgi:hypothetical protein
MGRHDAKQSSTDERPQDGPSGHDQQEHPVLREHAEALLAERSLAQILPVTNLWSLLGAYRTSVDVQRGPSLSQMTRGGHARLGIVAAQLRSMPVSAVVVS